MSELLFFQVFSNSIDKGANLFCKIAGVNMSGLGSVGLGLETVLGKFHVDKFEEIEWCWFVMQVCAGLVTVIF